MYDMTKDQIEEDARNAINYMVRKCPMKLLFGISEAPLDRDRLRMKVDDDGALQYP